MFLTCAASFYLFSTLARIIAALAGNAFWTEPLRKIVILRFDALMTGMIAASVAVT